MPENRGVRQVSLLNRKSFVRTLAHDESPSDRDSFGFQEKPNYNLLLPIRRVPPLYTEVRMPNLYSPPLCDETKIPAKCGNAPSACGESGQAVEASEAFLHQARLCHQLHAIALASSWVLFVRLLLMTTRVFWMHIAKWTQA